MFQATGDKMNPEPIINGYSVTVEVPELCEDGTCSLRCWFIKETPADRGNRIQYKCEWAEDAAGYRCKPDQYGKCPRFEWKGE